MMDALEQLKDIHLPEKTGMFPAGFGWLVLVALLIVLVLGVKIWRTISQKNKRKYALKLLEGIKENDRQSLIKISELLRRTCLAFDKKCAALYGKAWMNFLQEKAGMKISEKVQNLLQDAPYKKDMPKINAEDMNELKRFVMKFIGESL